MDAEDILGSLIRGALGGRRKKRHGALRALTGRGSLINSRTLLAAAGVAWGLYESAQRKNAMQEGGQGFSSPASTPPPPPPGADVPPLPLSSSAPASSPEAPADLLRLIRLTISAARADGTLTPEEEAAILEHARDVGLEAVARAEITAPWPLAQILAGFDPAAARDLYTLAFTIVRADEGVSGAERIYLAQLAHQLGLDPTEAAKLENEATSRIDEAATGA